jgi:GMP reductase
MQIFDYDNILLLPRKCRVESRSECDTSVTLGERSFRLPVVPANMKTVVDESICLWLAQNGYFYVMHRFDLDNVQFVKDMQGKGVFASISLGVKKPDYDTVDQLVSQGLVPEYVTIDIAHGHADSVKNMIGYLKQKLPKTFVIAGNVGTPEAVIDLENWGADATKVGIGRARSASPSSRPVSARAAGSCRRSSGARAWPPSRSLRTAASATTATSPRACASARRW